MNLQLERRPIMNGWNRGMRMKKISTLYVWDIRYLEYQTAPNIEKGIQPKLINDIVDWFVPIWEDTSKVQIIT